MAADHRSPSTSARRLAAVLFADIQGYTSLMQHNEQRALTALRKFEQVLNDLVPQHQGEVIQFYGDGCLAIFHSSVDATACAKSMQQLLQTAPSVPVRMGIHAGDVVLRSGNVFGDAVNIASRIESMAIPGSILLSGVVRDQIKNQEQFELAPMGYFVFKNVEGKMPIYALKAAGIATPDTIQGGKGEKALSQDQHPSARVNWAWPLGLVMLLMLAALLWWTSSSGDPAAPDPLLKVDEENSIAVLPFRNDSPRPAEDQYFCNGVAEAIRNNLAIIKQLQVVSRQSTEQYRQSAKSIPTIAKEMDVSYVLEGSVQRQDDRVKIFTNLYDGQAEKRVWTKSYELNLLDVFKIQAEVSQQIAQELKVQLAPKEEARIAAVPTSDMRAYDDYLLGKDLHGIYKNTKSEKDFANTLDRYNKALEKDPGFAQVYTSIAQLYWDRDYQAGYFQEAWLDTIPVLCQKAVTLDPNLDTPHYLLGVYYHEKNQPAKARYHLEKAVELNPNFAEAQLELGLQASARGEVITGLTRLLQAVQLDRSDFLGTIYGFIGTLYYTIGDFDNAEHYLSLQLEQNPGQYGPLFWFKALQGAYEEALQYAQMEYNARPNALYSLEIMALAYMYLSDFEQSLSFFSQWNDQLKNEGAEHYTNRLRNRYAFVLWHKGKRDAARQQFEINTQYLKKALALDRNLTSTGAGLYDLAASAAFLGNKEEAYQWLQQFAQHGWAWGSVYFIEVDPLFEPLWEEKAFKQIVQKAREEKATVRRQLELLN